MPTFGDIAWSGFSFAFGFFNLFALTIVAATRDGAYTYNRKMSEEEKKELAEAQKKYWDLSLNPLPGFKHKFYALKNGVKLHYVVNDSDEKVKAKNVAIFIHGFPDSYLLWKQLLTSTHLASYVLIAVDLPGYGGSDSLETCDPGSVLGAMTSFILGMREQYLAEEARLVVMAHDWGAVVSARLASEAPQLADRFILVGGLIPQHAVSNTQTHVASSTQMLHTWTRSPLNFRLLRTAFSTLAPVQSQIARFFYIFILNLPRPIANAFIRSGNFWFLRILHRIQGGLLGADGKAVRKFETKEAADWMAMSAGPGAAQFHTEGEGYSASAKARVADFGMTQKIRLYREGLATAPWDKPLDLIVALSELPKSSRAGSGAGLFEDGPQGAFKVPATVIHGKFDSAYEPRIMMDGMDDYLTKGSQVISLLGSKHWMPHEKVGAEVLTEIAAWALEGEKQGLKERLEGEKEGIRWVLEK